MAIRNKSKAVIMCSYRGHPLPKVLLEDDEVVYAKLFKFAYLKRRRGSLKGFSCRLCRE